jgi:hypothetical protein
MCTLYSKETKDHNMTEITESAKNFFETIQYMNNLVTGFSTVRPLPLKRLRKEEAQSCFAVVFHESFPFYPVSWDRIALPAIQREDREERGREPHSRDGQ